MAGDSTLLRDFQCDAGQKPWVSPAVLGKTLLIRALCGDQWKPHYQRAFSRRHNRVTVENLEKYQFSFNNLAPHQWHTLIHGVVHAPPETRSDLPTQIQEFYTEIMKVAPSRLGNWTPEEKLHRFLSVYAGDAENWQPYWKAEWNYLRPDTVRTVQRFLSAHPTISQETLHYIFSLC